MFGFVLDVLIIYKFYLEMILIFEEINLELRYNQRLNFIYVTGKILIFGVLVFLFNQFICFMVL